jgi:Flagellar regulatory protein FleQ
MKGAATQTTIYGNAPAQRSSSRRVLVIDAYASGRRTICTCIVELGHEAIAAAAADEDWLIAAVSEIDLIVANCDDEVSCALLAQLHAKIPEIPTLMLSSHAQFIETIPDNTVLLARALTLETLERAIAVLSRDGQPPIGRIAIR